MFVTRFRQLIARATGNRMRHRLDSDSEGSIDESVEGRRERGGVGGGETGDLESGNSSNDDSTSGGERAKLEKKQYR